MNMYKKLKLKGKLEQALIRRTYLSFHHTVSDSDAETFVQVAVEGVDTHTTISKEEECCVSVCVCVSVVCVCDALDYYRITL